MATLRVLNGSGDARITWSTEGLERGEPDAQAAVREAERIFARERARGAVGFRVLAGLRQSGSRRSTRSLRTPCSFPRWSGAET